jgi:hypothetical protein
MQRVDRIAAARAAAIDALAGAASGDSLCTMARERLPAAKYHEGAVAALGDALRASRRGDPLPDSEAWGAQWSRLTEHDAAWRAYVLGGREALSQV